jgi:hypothetical protein
MLCYQACNSTLASQKVLAHSCLDIEARMAISESIFASSCSPAVRPSHLRKHDGLSPAEALERFEHEQLVLEHQLKEW